MSEYQEDLICPFCSHKQFITEYRFNLGSGITECDECNKKFYFYNYVITRWKAESKPCLNDEGLHRFKEAWRLKAHHCMVCETCGFEDVRTNRDERED